LTPASPPRRLLAVDDNGDSAELIARIATRCGYEARAVADLRELPDLLAKWRPDVLTLDLCMPQEDGIAVLPTLNESGFEGGLLIISGQEDWLRRAAGRLASAQGLNVIGDLAKPIDIKTLRETLIKFQDNDAAA
jgi:two-component system chemotaxis response regulator CheB